MGALDIFTLGECKERCTEGEAILVGGGAFNKSGERVELGVLLRIGDAKFEDVVTEGEAFDCGLGDLMGVLHTFFLLFDLDLCSTLVLLLLIELEATTSSMTALILLDSDDLFIDSDLLHLGLLLEDLVHSFSLMILFS